MRTFSRFVLVLSFIQSLQGQNSILNTTGGEATLSGIRFEWSVGESGATETFTGNGTILTQGFLQPIAFTISTPISEQDQVPQVNIYPNPFVGILQLKATVLNGKKYGIRIYNLSGELQFIWQQRIEREDLSYLLDLGQLGSGIYLLSLYEMPGGRYRSSYRIHKN